MLKRCINLFQFFLDNNVVSGRQTSNNETGYCSEAAREADLASCLSHIKEVLANKSLFWFGEDFINNCPPGNNVLIMLFFYFLFKYNYV